MGHRRKRQYLIFGSKIMAGILIAATIFGMALTILSFSVACIWGGDEAVDVAHMAKLAVSAIRQEDIETAGREIREADCAEAGNDGNPAPEQDKAAETTEAEEVAVGAAETTEKTEAAVEATETTEAEEVTVEEAEENRLEQRIAETEFPYYIKVNRKQCCITVYAIDEDGSYTIPYKAMVCSTGLYNRTPLGTFQISDKYVWRDLNGGVCGQYASRVVRGVLFHSVPYYSHSKNALCTSKYNKLGEQASAGCIRLTVADAKWIYDNCPSGTTVEIYEEDEPGPLGKPNAVKIDLDSPNKGWDPTDPDADNPWRE